MSIVPSDEQKIIIDYIKGGFNVKTDSVAGSGKTTTNLLLAQSLPTKRIILVTYNSRLKSETRERVKLLGLKNIEVHSFHSLGLAYYIDPCRNDLHLSNIVKFNLAPKYNPNTDILVLDETQDMTKCYYDFIIKFIKDLKTHNLQFLIMGDHMQCIYDFAQVGADYRYLTLAEHIFPSKKEWKKCYLRTSYRITNSMEWFVNDVLLGYSRMKSIKESNNPVKYITGDPFNNIPSYFASELKNLFSNGIVPGDIFILAPSIRSYNQNNPIKKFENILVRLNIPCFVPLNDDEELNDDVINGKVVFSSFHQSKGLERKVVIVASFNSSFYFTAKSAPKEICPNIIYVASTRSLEHIYFWGEGPQSKPLPFLKHHLISTNDKIQHLHISSKSKKNEYSDSSDGSDSLDSNNESVVMRRVTDLTRFIPEESMNQILELCRIVTLQKITKNIETPSFISTIGGKKENVSDLNGIAIPTIYEHRKKNFISIQNDMETYFMNTLREGGSLTKEQKEWIYTIQKDPSKTEDYLKMANIYSAYISGYLYKISQIKEYNWLGDNQIEDLLNVLESVVKGDPNDMCFEETLDILSYEFNNIFVDIAGRADLIDSETLWEIKCVDTVSPEHFVQLALYAWLWQTTMFEKKGTRKFKLVNLKTAEVYEISGIENLNMIVDICLDNAFRKKPTITDDEFISICLAGPDVKSNSKPTVYQCMILDD
jgi:hypothetical protein